MRLGHSFSKNTKAVRRLAEEIEILHESPLVDPVWYRQTYQDLRDTPIDVARHYLEHGAREGRNPHPLFDTKFYLRQNPDVVAAGDNPLVHYILYGAEEGRNPHPLFDTKHYVAQIRLLQIGRVNALSHYLTMGWKQGLRPHRFFDPVWYLEQYPDVRATGVEPLSHYLQWGWRQDRQPNASLDPLAYRAQHGLSGDANPLVDLVLSGELRLRQESVPCQDAGASTAADTASNRQEPPKDAGDPRLVRDVHYEVWQAPGSLKNKNACLLVAYSPNGYIPNSTLHYGRALKQQGLTVIVIVASRNSGRPYADAEIVSDGLISRDNLGYDFASWALGLQILPSIWQADSVLFTNDSIFGPLFQPHFARLMQRIAAAQADYVGLTQSWQVRHHYQSYFFVLKKKALGHRGVRNFWNNLKIVKDRDQAIDRYEVPMLEMIKGLGLQAEVMFPLGDRDFEKDINPALHRWRELVHSGFPFIKVQTLRDDISGVDKANWDREIQIDAKIKAAIIERLGSKAERTRKVTVVRPGR